jgi:hypothetical protein
MLARFRRNGKRFRECRDESIIASHYTLKSHTVMGRSARTKEEEMRNDDDGNYGIFCLLTAAPCAWRDC